MVRFLLTIIASTSLSAYAQPSGACKKLHAIHPDPKSFRQAFAPALITGASVSNDFGGIKSPAKRVLEQFGARYDQAAFPHEPSEKILELLSNLKGKRRYRTLIAVDLFFWDPEKGSAGSCEKGHVTQVIASLRERSRQLVLARIPKLLARGNKECMDLINGELETACTPDAGCRLAPDIPLDGSAGGADTLLQSDHLHLSDAGSALGGESVCAALLRFSN
jgi:hypothetical protein